MSEPWVGARFRAEARGLAHTSATAAVVGLQQLAIALPAAGAPCRLLATPDVVVSLPVIANGATIGFSLPRIPILAGGRLYTQVLQIDPFDLRIVSSNGLQLELGTF